MEKQSQLLLQPTKVKLGVQVGEEFDNIHVYVYVSIFKCASSVPQVMGYWATGGFVTPGHWETRILGHQGTVRQGHLDIETQGTLGYWDT